MSGQSSFSKGLHDVNVWAKDVDRREKRAMLEALSEYMVVDILLKL